MSSGVEPVEREAWVCSAAGSVDNTQLTTQTLPPSPPPGYARVRVEACGMNFADIFAQEGLYSAMPKGQSFIPGLEFSGVIEAITPFSPSPSSTDPSDPPKNDAKNDVFRTVGSLTVLSGSKRKRTTTTSSSSTSSSSTSSVGSGGKRRKVGKAGVVRNQPTTSTSQSTDLTVGSKVMGVTRFGGYVTRIDVEIQRLQPLPTSWEFEHGASFPVQSLTAFYALVELGGLVLPTQLGRLDACLPPKSVLIHSMAGGVGLAALQTCLALGSPFVGTVGSEWKRAWLLEEYAGLVEEEQIIVRTTPGAFPAQLETALLAIGRTGFDVVLDAIAGPWFKPALDKVASRGKHIIFGASSFTPAGNSPNYVSLAAKWLTRPTVDPMDLIAVNKAVVGFNLIWLWDEIEYLAAVKDAMLASVPWRRPHAQTFAFANMKTALSKFQSGQTVGKVVLLTDPSSSPSAVSP